MSAHTYICATHGHAETLHAKERREYDDTNIREWCCPRCNSDVIDFGRRPEPGEIYLPDWEMMSTAERADMIAWMEARYGNGGEMIANIIFARWVFVLIILGIAAVRVAECVVGRS